MNRFFGRLFVFAAAITPCTATMIYSGDSTGISSTGRLQIVQAVPQRNAPYYASIPAPEQWVSGIGNSGFGGIDGGTPVSAAPVFTVTESVLVNTSESATVWLLGDDAVGFAVDGLQRIAPRTAFQPGQETAFTFTLAPGLHALQFQDYNYTNWPIGTGNYTALAYRGIIPSVPTAPEPNSWILAVPVFLLACSNRMVLKRLSRPKACPTASKPSGGVSG